MPGLLAADELAIIMVYKVQIAFHLPRSKSISSFYTSFEF